MMILKALKEAISVLYLKGMLSQKTMPKFDYNKIRNIYHFLFPAIPFILAPIPPSTSTFIGTTFMKLELDGYFSLLATW